jgi:hypothetical protein
MGYVGSCYPTFVIFDIFRHRGTSSFSLLLGPIYITLEGCGSLPLLNFIFIFYRVKVSHVLDFKIFNLIIN